ncbi:NT-3 growth factor receptor-like [Pollicipes pollicipes]|uniref:NT-3 growth factor receptor-like n=1 Tax=Pollicipes pollicipes TaxID=41117 RepID=UPI001885960F|nr:NT-3 growth factor receptor-like [Pollicipes pollicipes]
MAPPLDANTANGSGSSRRRRRRRRRRRTRSRCRPDICGPEAACMPVGDSFKCVCPRDLSEVTPEQRCHYADDTTPVTTSSDALTMATGRPCPNPKSLCGMEAACQMVDDSDHVCICPHDLTEPTGDSPQNFRCNRNVVEDDSSPHPYLLSTNNGDSGPQGLAPGVPGWVLVLVPSLIGALVLVLVLVSCWRRRLAGAGGSRAAARKLEHRKLNLPVTITENIVLDDRVHSNPNYYHESPWTSPLSSMKVVHILKEQVVNMSEIGQGCFGKVYKGVYLPCEGEPVNVAVKLLKETANVELQEDFIREVEIMASCRHQNIVSLLGVLVQDTAVTPWMVFEYMAYGDLAELLRKNAPKWGSPQSSALDMGTLHSFADQVASGMEYLASQHFVHRDLACRNILVGEQMVVKISDFGMSRDIYTCDYYKVAGGSRMLPVRWMAPESISYGKFTLESDIWSYGVVLWEIYAYGKQPYYGHSNKEVVNLILQNILLVPPDTCPSAVCDIMDACWKSEPRDRTSFSDIVLKLAHMSDAMKGHRYANVDAVPYTELEHNLSQLARIEAEVRALGLDEEETSVLDEDLYLRPSGGQAEHDYIQPIP